MSVERAASIADLCLLARRRMPRFAFDFIDGGAEDETNLRKNRTAFEAIEILPRYLVNVAPRSTEVRLFNKKYAMPFGIAPMGFLNMAWPGADLMMAKLAATKRIPHVISTASSTPLEQLAEAADGYAWFQFYPTKNEAIYHGLLQRAEAVGCEVLVVTVDVPAPGKRDRDIRNRLEVPFRITPRIFADLALHPCWSLASLRAGAPDLANILPYKDAGAQTLAAMQANLISGEFDWDALQRLRDRWHGKLLLKGILHPEDASMAVHAGCDGVIVSNHGGRQVSYGPAAIAALPAVVRAVEGAIPILLDSGIRRGADIIRAKALGAEFVFAGRPFAYAAGAGGSKGCERVFAILAQELYHALGQIGCTEFTAVDASMLA